MTIKIKPQNKGLLTKKVGAKGLAAPALTKTISAAKKSRDVKLEKEAVFAKNAKSWNHSGGSKPTFKPNKKPPHLG